MPQKLFTCIIFFPLEIKPTPSKYRNITNIIKFTLFAKSIGATYINVYEKINRQFVEQIKLN